MGFFFYFLLLRVFYENDKIGIFQRFLYLRVLGKKLRCSKIKLSLRVFRKITIFIVAAYFIA